MIHGLRNDKADAVNKFEIAKRQLRKIGYKYPVIGYVLILTQRRPSQKN